MNQRSQGTLKAAENSILYNEGSQLSGMASSFVDLKRKPIAAFCFFT
jgi:hypothetical protein